jgi:hypothetical protein
MNWVDSSEVHSNINRTMPRQVVHLTGHSYAQCTFSGSSSKFNVGHICVHILDFSSLCPPNIAALCPPTRFKTEFQFITNWICVIFTIYLWILWSTYTSHFHYLIIHLTVRQIHADKSSIYMHTNFPFEHESGLKLIVDIFRLWSYIFRHTKSFEILIICPSIWTGSVIDSYLAMSQV